MRKKSETNTGSQAGIAVARSDFVALSASYCRRSSTGLPPRILNGEKGGDFQWIGRTLASFRAGGFESYGSTEAIFTCALAEGGRHGFGVWARSRRRAVAIRDQSQVLSGEVSAWSSGWFHCGEHPQHSCPTCDCDAKRRNEGKCDERTQRDHVAGNA
jgi:hypothetical protein